MSNNDEADDELEREARLSVLLVAQISGFGGGAKTRHLVRDLSSGGARVDRADQLRVGATVLVSVGSLDEVGATIIWAKDGLAGLRFAEVIDPDAARSQAAVSRAAVKGRAPVRDDQNTAQRDIDAGWVADLRDPYRQ